MMHKWDTLTTCSTEHYLLSGPGVSASANCSFEPFKKGAEESSSKASRRASVACDF